MCKRRSNNVPAMRGVSIREWMVPKKKVHIVCVGPISEAAGMAAAEFADAAEESRQLLVIPIHDRADHQWQHRSKRGPCDICGSRGARNPLNKAVVA